MSPDFSFHNTHCKSSPGSSRYYSRTLEKYTIPTLYTNKTNNVKGRKSGFCLILYRYFYHSINIIFFSRIFEINSANDNSSCIQLNGRKEKMKLCLIKNHL